MPRLVVGSALLVVAPFIYSHHIVQATPSPQARGAIGAPIAVATTSAVADPAAVVIVGQARFTVLTPQLVRMEWAADGRFEDRPSLVFINRRLPVPTFTRGVVGRVDDDRHGQADAAVPRRQRHVHARRTSRWNWSWPARR